MAREALRAQRCTRGRFPIAESKLRIASWASLDPPHFRHFLLGINSTGIQEVFQACEFRRLFTGSVPLPPGNMNSGLSATDTGVGFFGAVEV